MRVLARLLIVIALMVGSFLALLLATELFQRRQSAAVLLRAGERRDAALKAGIEAASAPLAAYVDGLRAVLRPSSLGTSVPEDGNTRIGGSPGAIFMAGPFGASEVRVDSDFPDELAKALLEAAWSPSRDSFNPVFFVVEGGRIAECRIGVIVTDEGEIRFAVSRLWGDAVLDGLARQSGGAVRITFAKPEPSDAGDGGNTRQGLQFIPLHGPKQGTVAWLAVNFDALTMEQLRVLGAQKLMVLLGFSIVVMIVLAFVLTRWIARPIGLIGQSLEAQDAGPLRTLLSSRAEFGQFAQLIKTTLDQKAELGREIEVRKRAEAAFMESVEERLRLSRDLHDGVIQSIYAAGLTIEGIAKLIEKDPDEARRRLEQCLQGLNDTISQLRGYLLRSGESPSKKVSVVEEFQRLAETLRAGHDAEIAMEIVEDAAASLDPESALQLLLIGREAITNALRHSGARTIAVTLRPVTDRMVAFEVRDDGSGIATENDDEGRGHGLANMTRRAEELGGSLEIESRPGVGTRIRVELPVKSPT